MKEGRDVSRFVTEILFAFICYCGNVSTEIGAADRPPRKPASEIRRKEVPPMSYRTPSREGPETPIERIFQKVMHRKMTREERAQFHLKDGNSHNFSKSNNGAGGNRKNGSKLTPS